MYMASQLYPPPQTKRGFSLRSCDFRPIIWARLPCDNVENAPGTSLQARHVHKLLAMSPSGAAVLFAAMLARVSFQARLLLLLLTPRAAPSRTHWRGAPIGFPCAAYL